MINYFLGEWRIAITYSGEHINGSPFPCLVYDSNNIKVNYNDQSYVHENTFFSVDTRKAGWGTLSIKVVNCTNTSGNNSIPIKIDERGNGIYNVSFEPNQIGKYLVYVTFNKQEVPDSPFEINVDHLPSNDLHNQLKKTTINDRLTFNGLPESNSNKLSKLPIEVGENNVFETHSGKTACLELNNLSDSNMLTYSVKGIY